MKKLLATTALAIFAVSGAASAQSVLERVLSEIDNSTNLASVNGTFANIAENIGGATTVYDDGTNVIGEDAYNAGLDSAVSQELSTITATEGATTFTYNATTYDTYAEAAAAATTAASTAYAAQFTATTVWGGGIDGSINNTLDGIDAATQQAIAGTVSAIEWNMPTVDLGDMATTALGAVNTGDITLGVNSAVDEASTSTTNAVSAVMNQLGGSADTGAIVLNVASNMTGVNGSINNVMNEVNGSIGNLSTTALGAVNTGTIVSGVDAAVAGIVGSSAGQ
ncbi:hypothetical protein [Phaeobacter gallaeciensis]|uniref:hypothetical protein n=1 Tax=Phaeobacter gallaeciensis TaxID=60890 RepID=UPI00237FBB23|nr:hypothetical protein [Phaeobacter gallaeciensis]MDE4142925.1 hypothetical protein [Phaeobacter gallaeciensis]MDE4151370.1 hypothetical protein [Phaeobacter gallaeciensis]MDE4155587.1 hypothetical protein [Phaeobacter gallaeciensis]MDE4230992.1 hypothetical protein [Phaeobacter gallaeciensis]MDE4260044.1 hypothetical protein [Phaeobacter gallaeciensis]